MVILLIYNLVLVCKFGYSILNYLSLLQKDEFAKKRAKKRQRENSEKVRNHQIVHSAFQIAFRDQILDDNSNSVDLPKKEQNRGKSREAVERRGRSRSGRSRRDLSAQLVDPQSHFYTDPSEAAPHLVRNCFTFYSTFITFSRPSGFISFFYRENVLNVLQLWKSYDMI